MSSRRSNRSIFEMSGCEKPTRSASSACETPHSFLASMRASIAALYRASWIEAVRGFFMRWRFDAACRDMPRSHI